MRMDDAGPSMLLDPARVRRIVATAYSRPVGSPPGRSRPVSGPCGSLVAETNDLDELVGVQRGAADQGAVDVGLRHDLGDVAGLDRAAVLDADLVGQLLVVQLG